MGTTQEKVEVTSVEQLLESEIPESNPQNDYRVEHQQKHSQKPNRDLVKNVNNQVLIDILSPEISENERAKRIHKYILISLLTAFLIIQFLTVYNLTTNIIEYSTSKDANLEILKALLAFVSAYITSVIVELITILYYIVQKVFDTSLTDLVALFKETEK